MNSYIRSGTIAASFLLILVLLCSSFSFADSSQNHLLVNAFDGPSLYSRDFSPSSISPPPPGTTVYVTAYIYGGLGDIKVSYPGGSYSNNSTIYLLEGQQITISPTNLNSNYVFYQWITNCGSIGNSMDSSTSFTPQGNGSLTMIIHLISPDYNWGGYIETGNKITSVSTQLVLPTSVSYVSGVTNSFSSKELVDFWVGIGGSSSSADLWQAGLSIQINSSSSNKPYVYAWYEYLYSGNNGPSPINVTGLQIVLGDTVDITISYNQSTGTSYYYFYIVNTGANKGGNLQFSPDTTTGEWIGEDPGGAYWVIPNFGNVIFSVDKSTSGSAYANLYAPILNIETWDSWQYNLFWSITQEMNPGAVSSGDQFTLSYSQTTTE